MRHVVSVAGLFVVAAAAFAAGPRTRAESAVPPAAASSAYFEPNLGQTDARADFVGRARGCVAFVEAGGGATFRTAAGAFRLSFVGADASVHGRGVAPAPGRSHYFIGDDRSKWTTQVPHFASLACDRVLPGVDVVWRADGDCVAYDLAFAPHADVASAVLRFEGTDGVAVTNDGALAVDIPGGRATMSPPRAWEEVGGGRRAVASSFVVRADGGVGFRVEGRDPARRLVVDPTIVFSTFVGGSSFERMWAIAVDTSGTYVSGFTHSTDYPATVGAFQPAHSVSGSMNAVVTKFAPDLRTLLWSTYLAGNGGFPEGRGIAVDAAGAVYVGGQAATGFPLVDAYQTTVGAGFVAKLHPTGASLTFSTYVPRAAKSLRRDGSGRIWFVADAVEGGTGPTGHVYTYDPVAKSFSDVDLGGAGASGSDTRFFDLAIDASGGAWLVGQTAVAARASGGALQANYGGGSTDGWIVHVDSAAAVQYQTYYGGSGDDAAHGVALDGTGDVHLTGWTNSTNFPTLNAWRSSRTGTGGAGEGWAARLDATAHTPAWSTYFGGAGVNGGGLYFRSAIAVNTFGEVAVVTTATSAGITTFNALQATYGGGGYDGAFLEFASDGVIEQATYMGGSGIDNFHDVTFDDTYRPRVAGTTLSANFPTTPPTFRATGPAATDADGFVAVLPGGLPVDADVVTLPGATVDAAYQGQLVTAGGASAFQWSALTALPTGVSLAADGALAGTPTVVGTRTFVAHTVDAGGARAGRRFQFVVNPRPSIPPVSRDWTVGRPASIPLSVNGGTAPYSWGPVTGDVPPGAAVDATGIVTSPPFLQTGPITFHAQVVDVWGAAAVGDITMRLNATPTVTTSSIPAWTASRPFVWTFSRRDGTPPFTWSVVEGTFPVDPWSTTGLVSGTTGAPGDHAFTVRATDVAGATADRALTMHLNPAPRITRLEAPWAAVDRPYAGGFEAVDGTPPLAWDRLSGALSDGLTFVPSDGTVTGTPTTAGRFPFVLRCSDIAGAFDTRVIVVDVADRVDLARPKARKIALDGTVAATAASTTYLELLAGTELTFVVAQRGKGDAPVDVKLFDASQTELDFASYATRRRGRLQVRGFPVPATGRYFLRLAAGDAFQGRVTVACRATPQRTWTGAGRVDPAGAPLVIPFSAAPGSRVTVRVVGAAATVASLVDGSGVEVLVAEDLRLTKAGATLRTKTLLAGGDYTLTIAPRGVAAGDVKWTVAVASPKQYAFALPDLAAGDRDD